MLYEAYVDIPNWLLTAPDDCKANIIIELIKNHLNARKLSYDLLTLSTAIHINVILSSVTFQIEVESLPTPSPRRSLKRPLEEDEDEEEQSDKIDTITSVTLKFPWNKKTKTTTLY